MLDRRLAACIAHSFPLGMLLVSAANWQIVARLSPELGAHARLGAGLLALTTALWAITRSVDPGKIDRKTPRQDIRAYASDGAQPRYCQRCAMDRPVRTKHCYACDHCVQRFDHHCIWLGACVGLGNHRLFLGLLACGSATCAVELALALRCIASRASRFNGIALSLDGSATMARGERIPLARLLCFLAAAHPDAAGLLLFAAVMTCIVGTYTGWCAWLAARDLTSYEVRRGNGAVPHSRAGLARGHEQLIPSRSKPRQ
jgi:palmitoyltransferase